MRAVPCLLLLLFVGDGAAEPSRRIAIRVPESFTLGGEFVILGNSREAVLRLAARRLFWREPRVSDYEVVSGDLSKAGNFLSHPAPLSIDRHSDRDAIATRDEFFRSQKAEEHDGVVWKLRESERPALARWEPVLRGFRRNGRSPGLEVRLFPDAVTKGRYTGSSRPADLSGEQRGVRVDLDVSAPLEPDLISPALAAAAHAADDRRLLARPVLLYALGARARGRWWGRDVRSFGAFVEKAGVEPTRKQVMTSDPRVSPVLAVGAAASWLEAGFRSDGETAVRRVLTTSDSELTQVLERWRQKSIREEATPPRRRPLPSGFLRGLSYAMTNSIDGSYASPRSRETLERLAHLSVNSISIMPYAFAADARRPTFSFVHRHPSGETDEGTVRAISDAGALGMTAMVKPQIWLGGGQFVGELSMASEEEWHRWFDAYRQFIVHHAVIAEAAGAALFCVGTELVKTEAHEKGWRKTIAAVRMATGAPILYASNWAAGSSRIGFWDALDAIGCDFYDPLSSDPAASDDALEEGARQAARPLEELAGRIGKPVIFAEAGYPPVRAAWVAPHDENSGRPHAPADAARAVAAVFRALGQKNWWKGVYWWKAFSGGQAAHADDRGYNLLGTPAEKTIAEGFARLSRERGR